MFDYDIEINGCGHFSMNPFEVETSGFFGKLVVLDGVLLRQTHEGTFCLSGHRCERLSRLKKGYFTEADTGERMFY